MSAVATLFRICVWAIPLALMGALMGTLSGCASTPASLAPASLFNDAQFAPPQQRINADDVFALSDEMRHYLDTEIAQRLRGKSPREGLFDALYDKRQLRLEYDATFTRNAAEAFAARTGNCMSLVIMTGAFAKALGLNVVYQAVLGKQSWSRSDDLYFASGHVNLSLGGTTPSLLGSSSVSTNASADDSFLMTIDFVAPEEMRNQRRRQLQEETIIAMYMNNRAAEHLALGETDTAYWWVRAAMLQDPKFLVAYNTLGVIYRRHGNLKEAERILRYVLEREPGNLQAMANLALTLSDQGKKAEAQALSEKLQQLRSYPPFYFFDQGVAAMNKNDYKSARDLFSRELDRDQYYHEFHAWLAAAYMALGELKLGRKELGLALENSPTRKERNLYAAKLKEVDAYEQ